MRLEVKERARVREYKEKIEKTTAMFAGGIATFLLVLSFIPAGFIPHRNARRVDGNSSLADLLGVGPTLLFAFIIGALIAAYLLNGYKYFAILKDLKEEEKDLVKVKVEKVVRKDGGGGMTEIELFFKPRYKNRRSFEFIDFRNFPRVSKGQEVEIEITRNALHPIAIRPIGEAPIDDVATALELIRKLKEQGGGDKKA